MSSVESQGLGPRRLLQWSLVGSRNVAVRERDFSGLPPVLEVRMILLCSGISIAPRREPFERKARRVLLFEVPPSGAPPDKASKEVLV